MPSLPEHCHLHPLWHLSGVGLFLALCAVNRWASSSGIAILALWNLAGVILHELSHLVAGILFRARPTGISLLPRRNGDHWQLGAVRFSRVTALNAVPIALAPLALAGIAYLVAQSWFSWAASSWGSTLGLYAVVFVLLYNALPSRQDLRVAANWRSILLYAPALTLLAIFLYRYP